MRDKIEWLKEHKMDVLIATGVLIGTVSMAVIGVKSHKAKRLHMASGEKIAKACEEASNAIVSRCTIDLEKLPIKELGNVGKRFLDAIPEATEDTLVNVIAYIEKTDL